MDDPYAVDRRGFLKTGATAAAATAVACGVPEGRWRALTNEEARTLAAACDQIVPPDDSPGAAEAGVVVFIDRQLATREKDQLETWQRGVRAIEATAQVRQGMSFAELTFEEQTALLEDIEAGRVPAGAWEGLDPRAFFGRLVRYTMMGYYGDPRHGGNREHVSWRMLGVSPVPIRGRLHEVPVATPAVRKTEVE
ncbi:MAG: gluconate 2-dehydrogenase subunit 3 family protein [Acidobacteria bacterium]|jgi:gluconate 2-dehydrogenase gamma chain|nr:gluconate 2-dehydrogenase subunit 3 family protein [Acidobacteriota bacterium]